MKKIICFDLMETLIFPPNRKKINNWILERKNILTDFQKKMYFNGFPYAAFTYTPQDLEKLKKIILCMNIKNIRDIFNIMSMEYDLEKEKITIEYILFFLKNYQVHKNIFILLDKLTKIADLNLISNLYSVYKPLIYETKIKNYFKQIFLSCDVKEKKPSISLINKTQFEKYNKKIFVGDNWTSDLVIPLKLGFYTYFCNKTDIFINTLFQKGVAFLLEKDECYKVKEKYKKIVLYYFAFLIDVEHITKDDLIIVNNKLYFEFMRRVKLIKNISDIDINDI